MSTANVVWANPVMTLGVCAGAGTDTITCSGFLLCSVVCLTPINARLNGIATAFIDPPDGTEVTTSFLGLTVLGAAPAATWTMNTAQQALDFSWAGQALIGIGTAQITIRAPAASAWTTSATNYLATNRWDQVTHYSVSPRYALTGTNACSGVGPGTCITLDSATDRQAVLTMTGRALVGQNRGVTAPIPLAAYLEGGNTDPTDLALERNLLTSSFNDQPFVVRP
jgi:hypothetical protein